MYREAIVGFQKTCGLYVNTRSRFYRLWKKHDVVCGNDVLLRSQPPGSGTQAARWCLALRLVELPPLFHFTCFRVDNVTCVLVNQRSIWKESDLQEVNIWWWSRGRAELLHLHVALSWWIWTASLVPVTMETMRTWATHNLQCRSQKHDLNSSMIWFCFVYLFFRKNQYSTSTYFLVLTNTKYSLRLLHTTELQLPAFYFLPQNFWTPFHGSLFLSFVKKQFQLSCHQSTEQQTNRNNWWDSIRITANDLHTILLHVASSLWLKCVTKTYFFSLTEM